MSTEVNHAREQAIAKVESIKALMARLGHCEGCSGDSLCSAPFEQQLEELGYMSMFNPGKADEIADEYHDADKARKAIEESPLSVEVRSGWVSAFGSGEGFEHEFEPVEYNILLCTGGPAVRIIGTLGRYSEPDTARIEYQNWGTPWTEMRYGDFHERPNGTAWTNALVDKYLEDAMAFDALLLSYARQFWYGE